jgi:protein involved in sex pheromone biosynthesis
MIRTVITPDNEKISIDLPHNYIGKKVEVIAFTIEEASTVTDKVLTHIASEKILTKDWLTPEEDEAWKDL